MQKGTTAENLAGSEDEDGRHGSAENHRAGEAGFKQANEWRVTAVVSGPVGRITKFDASGGFVRVSSRIAWFTAHCRLRIQGVGLFAIVPTRIVRIPLSQR